MDPSRRRAIRRYRQSPACVWYEQRQSRIPPALRALRRLYWKSLQVKRRSTGTSGFILEWCSHVANLMAKWRRPGRFTREQLQEIEAEVSSLAGVHRRWMPRGQG